MVRKLIVNADDFGRAPGVCQGILEAHRSGIVTSTTVMINQPAAEQHLAEALSEPDLGVGLHLVFTAWKPILPPGRVPGLVDPEGYFLDQHTVWARAERLPIAQLKQELTAQVQRFALLAGRLPDHLDCHHFVHLYPPFFQVYADMAAEYRLPLRVPFRVEPSFRVAAHTLPYLEGFPQDLVRGMIVTNSSLLSARKLAHPDHFVGSFFGRRALTLDTLFGLMEALPEGTSELMCHPGYVDAALAGSSYRTERELELALLTDPRLRARVKDMNIELVTFSALPGAVAAA